MSQQPATKSEEQLSAVEAAIEARPRPLVTKEHKLVLFWTPKVGSTAVVKWFFTSPTTSGPRGAPIHLYRHDVFDPSPEHQASLQDYRLNYRQYRHVKVVRNPYGRAVSSYVQLLKMAHINRPAFKRFFEQSSMPADNKLSFAQFVEQLEKHNIERTNLHWQQQLHPLETVEGVQVRYGDLKQTAKFLQQVEEDFDLPRTRPGFLRQLKNQNHHTSRDEAPSDFVGDKLFGPDTVDVIPKSQFFYNDELVTKVRRIYRNDFRHYGSVRGFRAKPNIP